MTASTQTSGEGADEDPFLGRVLDQRYRLLRRLGEGGMGLVYEAKHEILGGRLAVKVLRSEAARDAESIERLKREAQSASAIGSDHIVDVRDFGRMQDGSTYVVMELIEGLDLFKEIRTAPLEWKRARSVALQICDALGKAHEGGIVHRDLKPENVLLTTRRGRSDFVKIVDFGIAKMEGSAKITAAGRVMGTPEYMSPEQCAGISVDHRTDIYSLGVLLFEMVTGELPFANHDLATLVRMQIKDPPPSPARVRPQAKLPADFERIVLFCLNKHADDRYASMREVAEALRAIDEAVLAEGSQGEARRLTPREAAVTQVYVEGDAEPPPTREALASEETPEKRQSGPRDVEHVEHRGVGPSTTAVIPATRPRSIPLWVWAVAAVALALGIAVGISSMGTTPEATAAIRASEEVSDEGPATDEVSPEPTPAEPSAREEESPTSPAPIAPDPGARTFVTLESDPSAAGVYRDGALVGETPLEMVRPGAGERLELTLRASGYRDHQVVLGPLTAPQLRVVLERAPRTGSRPPEAPAAARRRSAPPRIPRSVDSVIAPTAPDEALRRALARRGDWLREQADAGTDCVRLLHGTVEGAPGLTVDRYGEVLLIQTGREPLEAGSVDRLARVANDALGRELVPVWNHRPAFREPGGFARIFAAPNLRDARGHEEGMTFRADPRGGGLDPLLFLDLRAGRRRVRELASGARVLNLFAYTCGLGVAAAAGGAIEVVNVDFASSALAVGAENAALNGVDGPSMSFVQEDFFPVVRQLAGLPVKGRGARGRDYLRMAPRTFDLIALDPPRWAKTPFGAVDVGRDYPSLLKPVLLATEPGGVVLATNHLPTVALEDFLATLHRTAHKLARRLEEVEVVTPDPDFPSPDGRPPLKMVVARVR